MPNQKVIEECFHALGDRTRMAVVERLSQGPATVKELADPFTMALPSFLQHLRVLENSGLILSTKRGRSRTCWLNPAGLAGLSEWIERHHALWTANFDRLDAVLTDLQQD